MLINRYLLIFFFTILSYTNLYSQTVVANKQMVYGNWTKHASPYIIKGEAIVPLGKSLTIEQGVEIQFETGKCTDYRKQSFDVAFFRINGELLVQGTDDKPVVFTRKGNKGYWGLLFFDTRQQKSILKNCVVEFASNIKYLNEYCFYGALSFYKSSAIIENCVVADNAGKGIDCMCSNPFITNATIANNKSDGMYCYDSSPLIINTIFSGNYSAIVVGEASRKPQVWYSYIQGNQVPASIIDMGSNILGESLEFIESKEFRYQLPGTSSCHNNGKDNSNIGAQLYRKAIPPVIALSRTPKEKIPPEIEIFRMENTTIDARQIIKGKAFDNSGVAIIEINGKEARIDANGNFMATVLLKPGKNSIIVRAVDIYENQNIRHVDIYRHPSYSVKNGNNTQINTTGKYFALLIAIDSYNNSEINDLNQTIYDANRLRKCLLNYNFQPEHIISLTNPGRHKIISTLDELNKTISEDDNLLIFYSGHGYWDNEFEQGYWFPSDASRRTKANWISNSTIRDYIRGIKSKHTLLVTDACFSGSIFNTKNSFSLHTAPRSISELYKLPSRKAITSGTLTEVPEKSVFIDYLIKRLQENDDKYLPAQQLFIRFSDAVINNSPLHQIPQYGNIRQTGDEGGDFIFIKP